MNPNHTSFALAVALLVAPLSVPVTAEGQETSAAAKEASRRVENYQLKEARAAIDPVAGNAGTDAAVGVALGRVLEAEKKYDEAASVLRKAAAAAPGDPAPALYLGETLLRAKKQAEAEAAWNQALDLAGQRLEGNPKDADALFAQGVALQRLKRYDEAVAALSKAGDVEGGSARTLFQIGVTRTFQEKWADAVDQLNKAVAKESGLAYAYYYRGLAYDKLGKKAEAVVDMDRFLKLAPEAPEAGWARAVLRAAKR
jgi:tetratricopeptide (TPR) repeat protein